MYGRCGEDCGGDCSEVLKRYKFVLIALKIPFMRIIYLRSHTNMVCSWVIPVGYPTENECHEELRKDNFCPLSIKLHEDNSPKTIDIECKKYPK